MEDYSFVIVRTDVLAEVFSKVLEVKRMIACGEEKSSASACKKVGISRSAYYKYRDCIFKYNECGEGRIATFYAVLHDKPGVLSSLLAEVHRSGANILTVNQNIPIDGAAAVTISIRLNERLNLEDLRKNILSLDGISGVKLILGE